MRPGALGALSCLRAGALVLKLLPSEASQDVSRCQSPFQEASQAAPRRPRCASIPVQRRGGFEADAYRSFPTSAEAPWVYCLSPCDLSQQPQ